MSKYRIFIYLPIISTLIFGSFQSYDDKISPAKNCFENFLGKWEVDSSAAHYQFSIKLFSEKKSLEGQQCFVSKDGQKIDCFQDSDISIFLEKYVSETEIIVRVKSTFSDNTGIVNLKTSDGKLVWRLETEPKGEFYYPSHANLLKAK